MYRSSTLKITVHGNGYGVSRDCLRLEGAEDGLGPRVYGIGIVQSRFRHRPGQFEWRPQKLPFRYAWHQKEPHVVPKKYTAWLLPTLEYVGRDLPVFPVSYQRTIRDRQSCQ